MEGAKSYGAMDTGQPNGRTTGLSGGDGGSTRSRTTVCGAFAAMYRVITALLVRLILLVHVILAVWILVGEKSKYDNYNITRNLIIRHF